MYEFVNINKFNLIILVVFFFAPLRTQKIGNKLHPVVDCYNKFESIINSLPVGYFCFSAFFFINDLFLFYFSVKFRLT
jgi:hypothetical protein